MLIWILRRPSKQRCQGYTALEIGSCTWHQISEGRVARVTRTEAFLSSSQNQSPGQGAGNEDDMKEKTTRVPALRKLSVESSEMWNSKRSATPEPRHNPSSFAIVHLSFLKVEACNNCPPSIHHEHSTGDGKLSCL